MRVILASVIALILCIVSVPSTVRADAEGTAWLLGQINALRQRNGLAPLAPNPQLIAAANAHSTYLANNPWVDAHREENGSTPQSRARAAGYTGRVSENVAGGSNANAEYVFNWWMNSTVHRNNMLHSNWTEIGIGFAKGPRGQFYTLVFGNQAQSLPTPIVQPTAVAPPQDAPPPAQPPPGATGNTEVPKPASPTRRPPTRAPTATPTLTFTPSITYTPRPSFTPSSTPTALPPTSTAIVLEVSPQASPAPTDLSIQASATLGVTAVAVAAVAAVIQDQASHPPAAPQTETTPVSTIRNLIPWLLGLQVVVGGGLMVSSVFRRRQRSMQRRRR
jgi:hypothetical protein